MAEVFNYTNFRTYLNDFYIEKKEKNPKFSYEAWAQKVGFTSKGFLYGVVHGDKKLSKLHCYKLSYYFKHTKMEASYFENIVFYAQEENPEDRSVFLQQALQCKSGTSTPAHLIRKDQYEYLSKWYHSVIRALVEIYSIKDDYERLARRLNPSITAMQAKKSVRLLERLGLIKKDSGGVWRITDKNLKTGDEISQTAKNNYHLECNDLAKKSIQNYLPETQYISSVMISISENAFECICKETKSFKNRIIELANNDKSANRVYQYQFTLFPVTKKESDS
jgi:uncharacterized protein (TIGR02147 family)